MKHDHSLAEEEEVQVSLEEAEDGTNDKTYGSMDQKQSYFNSVSGTKKSTHKPSAARHEEFLARQLKAEVADTYAICSALLTGFCVCTIFIDHASIEHEKKADPLRYYVLISHQVIVRLCTALALFSTLIFMLSTMYMKTALARQSYAFRVFDRFTNETSSARKMAFWCMYYACIMYMLSISLVMFYTMPRSVAVVVASVVLVFCVVMWWYADAMVKAAGVIFMPDEKLADEFANDTPRSCDTKSDSDEDTEKDIEKDTEK